MRAKLFSSKEERNRSGKKWGNFWFHGGDKGGTWRAKTRESITWALWKQQSWAAREGNRILSVIVHSTSRQRAAGGEAIRASSVNGERCPVAEKQVGAMGHSGLRHREYVLKAGDGRERTNWPKSAAASSAQMSRAYTGYGESTSACEIKEFAG